MNPLKAVRDHWLRIDARSLGLFRLVMGVVLIGDLFRRARYLRDFYTNEGVLPNHNHLFNLRETGHVWSALHAVSSIGESQTAFCLILFFYACFLIGWHTRAFQVAALVCLVSLDARNILLENGGNNAAIALLAFTLFLPLGSRFSLDSLRASLAARDEKGARALNARPHESRDAVAAARSPGWSPVSLAAFAVLAQLAIIYLAMGLQQKGDTWENGTALYYSLNAERMVSAAGVFARAHVGEGVLSLWTRAFRAAELLIPALIFFPFGWRVTRGVAGVLVLFTGLTLGVFFSFGLLGWSLAASAALLVPQESWDRIENKPAARRVRTVIYDADCGVCLWLSRLLTRLDLRENLTFQGNDDLSGLNVRSESGAIGGSGGAAAPPDPTARRDLPKEVTADLVNTTVVVVDPEGRVHTRARAVAEVVRALPLGWLVAWAMKLPGIVHLLGVLYDFVAARRQRISVAMGKEACGIDDHAHRDDEPPPVLEETAPPPATRIARAFTGLGRDLAVAVVLAAALAQTTAVNDLPWKVPQPKWLAGVAAWPRMLAHWDVLASPPVEDEVMVVDAQTRGGKSIDPLTGKEPVFDPGAMHGTGLGQLWNDYLYRIHQREWIEFQRAFRDYIAKGGPKWQEPQGEDMITGLDVYWLKQPIPPPGQPRVAALSARDKMFSQSRGGRFNPTKGLPLLRPDLINRKR